MTASANSLTTRAGTPAPMMPASQVRAFGDALLRLGYDVPALLAHSGLGGVRTDDPDALVPCVALTNLLRAAADQRRVMNLAAHMAFHTPLGAYPLLDYLVLTSNTVGDALGQLQRYFHLAGAPFRLEVTEVPHAVRLLLQGCDAFMAQYETALAIHHLRQESRDPLRVSFVSLAQAPDDKGEIERLLGCAVRAPAAWSGIEFPNDAIKAPLRRRDPVLRRLLEGSARQAPTAQAATPQGTADRVRAIIAARIGGEAPEISAIAQQLAMAPRTLQRHLAADGLSFKLLVDNARRLAAERLLVDRSLAVAEVGYLVGFSEPSAFHRAFKRWAGLTPLEYRRMKSIR